MGFLAPKNKYKQEEAKLDQSSYGGTIGQTAQNAQDAYGAQQGVQNMLGQTAAGKGPNPAREMLQQQTGQNVNMAAGQAASARGVNPAMAARMAVDAGSQMNQQAAGQGATMQAQQSLAAQQGMMQNAQAMQQGQMGMYGAAGQLQNAQNQARIANTLGTGQINAGVAAQNAQMQAGLTGGVLNSAGAAGVLAVAAHGGEITRGGVRRFADGGEVDSAGAPQSLLHRYFDSLYGMQGPAPQKLYGGGPAMPPYEPVVDNVGGMTPLDAGSSLGQAAVAPPPPAAPAAPAPAPTDAAGGQRFSPGANAFDGMKEGLGAFQSFAGMRTPGLTMAQGGPVSSLFEEDGFVPGEPEIPGDAEENDTVPALLSPGEVVIPRSIAQSPNAPEEAASFVAHLMRRQGREDDGYGRILKARQYAEGGAVQDPENFKRRELPVDEPMGSAGHRVPPVGLLPVYTGDADKARAEAQVKRAKMKITPEKLAEGGVAGRKAELAKRGYVLQPDGSVEADAAAQERRRVILGLGQVRSGPRPSHQGPMDGDNRAAAGYAEGGEVPPEPADQDFVEKVKGWWASLQAPTTEEVLEGANAALPDSLSARDAILKKRAQLRALDEQTR